jgi:hypothetical protein
MDSWKAEKMAQPMAEKSDQQMGLRKADQRVVSLVVSKVGQMVFLRAE